MMRNKQRYSFVSLFLWITAIPSATSFHISSSFIQNPQRYKSCADNTQHQHVVGPLQMSTRAPENMERSRTWSQGRGGTKNGVVPVHQQHSSGAKTAIAATPFPPTRSRQKTKPLPVTGYDYEVIGDVYDRRPLKVGWRLNSLGFPLLGTFFLDIPARLRDTLSLFVSQKGTFVY